MKEIKDIIPDYATVQDDPFAAFWKTDTHTFFVLIGEIIQIWKFPQISLQKNKYYKSQKFEFTLSEKDQAIQELTPISFPKNAKIKHDNPNHTFASWETKIHNIKVSIKNRWVRFIITNLKNRRNVNKHFHILEKTRINNYIRSHYEF